ncbi:hypothetical protein CNR22_22280 [Sphingobacteriaceae bacterium]|nr:hypothetical protein CNR22_22280 [Sphingobacteriaceae bacterium]
MKTTEQTKIESLIKSFLSSANKFDVEKVLTLFAPEAVIDDVSVGSEFKNTSGVRRYLETFFVGYKTKTKLLSLKVIDSLHFHAHVDFTGNFGHETGTLNFTINAGGLITRIDADLD